MAILSRPADDLTPAGGGRGLLRIGDLTAVELERAVELAGSMRAEPSRRHGDFDGAGLALFLDDPATRQHLSVATAAGRLGLLAVSLTAREVEGLREDPTGDTARVLSAYVAGLVVGTLTQRALRDLAAVSSVPVVNALSDEEDPIQAIADLVTLRARCGTLEGLVVAYIGPGDAPVAHSLMEAAARAGMHLRVACSPEHQPLDAIAVGTSALAPAHGGSVTVLHDPQEAVAGARAVYAAPWPERPDRAFQVDTSMLHRAGEGTVLLHPLPAYRGQEVTTAALASPHSAVFEQAANRLPAAQAAILTALS
jgi:ornithine carbamoyltransferase